MRFWISDSTITKYERARIIGARALQLSMGSLPLIDISSLPREDTITIAEMELNAGILPITIRRRLPNGDYVLVSVRKTSLKESGMEKNS